MEKNKKGKKKNCTKKSGIKRDINNKKILHQEKKINHLTLKYGWEKFETHNIYYIALPEIVCSTRCAPGTPRWEYGTARDPNTRREPQWPGSRKRTVLRIVLSVQEEGVTHFIGTTTKPGQTKPGQDISWTDQT